MRRWKTDVESANSNERAFDTESLKTGRNLVLECSGKELLAALSMPSAYTHPLKLCLSKLFLQYVSLVMVFCSGNRKVTKTEGGRERDRERGEILAEGTGALLASGLMPARDLAGRAAFVLAESGQLFVKGLVLWCCIPEGVRVSAQVTSGRRGGALYTGLYH